jgi:diphthamide biosynthesis methyltransferase
MLHLVGLGLADETDITVRGLEIVKRAERVYLEAYTSILLVDKSKLVSGHISLILFKMQLLSYHNPKRVTDD